MRVSRICTASFMLLVVSGCVTGGGAPGSNVGASTVVEVSSVTPVRVSESTESTSADVNLSTAVPARIWATNYYMLEVDSVEPGSGVPLRDLRNNVIGPELSERDWCAAAVEGTVRVDGKVFNYAGARDPRQADCRHGPSERVRWTISPHPFGVGSANNPLIPYRTIACDLGTVQNSQPWVDGGFPRFGQKILVSAAKGTRLPDGTLHDGVFTCGDTGGLITGNHIDVFIGAVRGGNAEAARKNPFAFVSNSPSRTVEAYLLP